MAMVKLGPLAASFHCPVMKFALLPGESKPLPRKQSKMMQEWIRGGGLVVEESREVLEEDDEEIEDADLVDRLEESREVLEEDDEGSEEIVLEKMTIKELEAFAHQQWSEVPEYVKKADLIEAIYTRLEQEFEDKE